MTARSPRLGWIADTAAVAALVAVAVYTWQDGAAPSPRPDAPAWATFRDALLDGPDAGRWAYQLRALVEGRAEYLDPHRSPTWTLLSAVVLQLTGLPVALAGHLTNHLLRVALGPVLYGLARALGLGRAPSLAVGIAVMLSPYVTQASQRFGVDPTVLLVWPASLLAALACAPRPWLSPLAGMVAGLATAAHFTTIPALLPALLALVFAAPPGVRLRSALGFVAGAAFVLVAAYRTLPSMDPFMLFASINHGIATPHQWTSGPVAGGRALEVLAQGLVDGVRESFRWLTFRAAPRGLPVAVVGVLLFVGALGPWLTTRSERLPVYLAYVPRRLRLPVEAAARGVGGGLPTLTVLTPVPLLFASQAAERYADNLLPVALVLVVRGVASVGAGLDRLAARLLAPRARWPFGVIQVALVVAFVAAFAWTNTGGRVESVELSAELLAQDTMILEAADALAARFPAGTGVMSPVPEVGALAGGYFCPLRRKCPRTADDAAFRACLQVLARECSGDGGIAYVIGRWREMDQRTPAEVAMDAWVAERWPPFAEFAGPALELSLVEIPREAAE